MLIFIKRILRIYYKLFTFLVFQNHTIIMPEKLKIKEFRIRFNTKNLTGEFKWNSSFNISFNKMK